MLLASSHPHDLSIKGMGARIILWPMDLPCHRGVLTDAAMDGRIAVHLGWVLRAVGDVGLRLVLVGHSICLELGVRQPTICRQLHTKKKQNDLKLCRIERINKEMNSSTHATAYWAR